MCIHGAVYLMCLVNGFFFLVHGTGTAKRQTARNMYMKTKTFQKLLFANEKFYIRDHGRAGIDRTV